MVAFLLLVVFTVVVTGVVFVAVAVVIEAGRLVAV